MKIITNIIIGITAFAVINCASTLSFAQKHSKKSNTDTYSSAPSRNYSNYSNNSSVSDWKFGGDFGANLIFLTRSSGAGITLNTYADYAVSNNIGIEAKLGWVRASNSADYSNPGSSTKKTLGLSQSSIGIGVSVRYDFSKNVFMTAGPRVYVPVGSLTVSADVTSALNHRHEEATFDGISTTAFGIEIGAGYRINVTNSIQIVPRASYQFVPSTGSNADLGGGLALTSSSVHSFQFSVGMMSTF
ncbi:MAG: outer membrane beta-barrel protein [Ignavibacteriota bacterium]